ncbi:hypothetical protein AAH342_001168 [Klebsiella oxytoca]|uniref:hypothetical protein n=1 Tax=Klebsiella oxytoca TaxID=571 RepID=UPI001B9D89F8|nr:hypothetical protein [Klebsiella oxytoca]MCW9549406.1 hypothetical protein [Klebsiella oxytoca]HBC7500463.1 hypothetical protein [Klebsiella oxytoca]HBM3061328.1 hypothetical protein [Klebsiella oxytoca]
MASLPGGDAAHLSGYRPADGCEPVARAGALRRARGLSAEWQAFPEAMLAHLSGLPARRRL